MTMYEWLCKRQSFTCHCCDTAIARMETSAMLECDLMLMADYIEEAHIFSTLIDSLSVAQAEMEV